MACVLCYSSLPSVTLVSTGEEEGLYETRLTFLQQVLNAFLNLVLITFQSFKTVARDSIEQVILIELSAAPRGTSVKNKKVLPVHEFFLFQFPVFDTGGF